MAGCFFCSRSDADCNDVKKIWTTVAYQLASRFPAFKKRLALALRRDPEIIYAHAPKQLQILIIDILATMRQNLVDCILVIDALDECRDADAISLMISILLQHAEHLSPIRFFLTSRPDAHIRGSFDTASAVTTTTRFLLHEVRLEVVKPDIKRFIIAKLGELRRSGQYTLPHLWPPEEQVEQLATNSHGLFIYVHTAVLFISDKNFSNPVHQLDILASPSGGTSSSFTRLDSLYLQILSSAFAEISVDLSNRLKKLLGAIITLQDPLPLADLAALLGLELTDVQNSLSNLHSVLIIPSEASCSLTIRIIHPTFADFLVDPMRCINPAFLVEPKRAHTSLLRGCLVAMLGTLKRDICDVRDPTLLNSEVPGLADRIRQVLPPYVRYACQFWIVHLEHVQVFADRDLLALVRMFFREKLLYWIEACSLLGILRHALLALRAAEKLIMVCQ